MSAQSADPPNCITNQEEEEEEEEILVDEAENNPVDILECLSIMINEDNGNDTEQVQELILDDQLLGTMIQISKHKCYKRRSEMAILY